MPFANVNVTLLFDLIITSFVAFSAKIKANVSSETTCDSAFDKSVIYLSVVDPSLVVPSPVLDSEAFLTALIWKVSSSVVTETVQSVTPSAIFTSATGSSPVAL